MKSIETIRNKIAEICEKRKRDGWKFSHAYWMGEAQECGCVVSAVNYPNVGFTAGAALRIGIAPDQMLAVEAGFCGWEDEGIGDENVAALTNNPELYDFGCELAEIYLKP